MEPVLVVRPNLGQPIIVLPHQLKSFEITVAGRDLNITRGALINYLEGLQLTFNSGGASETMPLWINMGESVDITPYPDLTSLFYGRRWPYTALEHQYLAGFRWECKLKVGIDVPDGWRAPGGWPAMCDITLKGRKNFHAIHIREELPDPNDLKFIHLTDTHIARRFDIMPQVICEYLEPWQKKLFLAKFRNFNDHLRAVIRYANQQAAEGKLDFIVLTGDIVDYYHDGYFEGDTYHFGYGKSAPSAPSEENSNFALFVEIITGRDGISEPLSVPIFVVPGNHDYLPYEPLLALDIDLWPDVSFWDKCKYYFACFFWLGFLIDETFHRYEGDEKVDQYSRPQLNKLEAVLFDSWKRGKEGYYEAAANHYQEHWMDEGFVSSQDYLEETMSLSKALRFATPSKDYFAQYLTDINYDTDFAFEVGNVSFVCLNTGQDVYLPSASEIIDSEGDSEKLPRRKGHALDGHPHNRGFITEHLNILDKARQSVGNSGLIFVLHHAPFFHDKGDPELPPDYLDEGWHYARTNDWKTAPADMKIDYDSAEGLFQLIGESCDNFTLSLAGHTHGKAEYRVRITKDPEGEKKFGVMCLFDRYSETLVGSHQWLNQHRPLFFVSGSLTSRHPRVREVEVGGNCLIKAGMQYLPRLRQQANAGSMACFLAGAVTHFAAVAGYKGSMKNLVDLSTLYYDVVDCDRDLVMWDMFHNFQQMYCHISDAISLGGFNFSGDCMTPRTDVHQYIDGWDYMVRSLLNRRNIEHVPDDQTAKYNHLIQVHTEIYEALRQMSGWPTHGEHEYTPQWYKEWYNGLDSSRRHLCPMLRLLMANIAVWINRFGLWPDDGANAISLRHQFESIDPYAASYGDYSGYIEDHYCPQHLVELFEFAALDDANPIRLWYAFESTYLAELGGYMVKERNELEPSVHLDWARSLPLDAIIADLIVKYQLQAEHQFKQPGIEGLRRFYSASAARLASWAAAGDSVDPEDYLNKCAGWDDQRILDDLTWRVNQVAQKLMGKGV
ncbi:MAG: metallophosphoesterase [Deltaproteobacteria bacterium]|nr:metallophosphoesterase [Deltaproteobacteria bacterium]MBW2339317.1 metallophosphoesterase [Deltaproteobacteria bacterium]